MRGRHSEIEVRNGVLVKKFPLQFRYNFWKELRFLSTLQPFSFVPRLYGSDPSKLEMRMEYIRGTNIGEAIMDISSKELMEIMDICRTLDRLGIQKEEMNHPDRHIIIGSRIVFVDFERGVIRDRPSNLTQFLVYLNFRRKIIPRDELISMMKLYKRNFSERAYRQIRDAVLRRID